MNMRAEEMEKGGGEMEGCVGGRWARV